MENNTFTYQYSAQRKNEAELIRKKYLPRETSKLEILRSLDRRVQTAGIVQSLTAGIIGCLIFGVGMCFGLDVFGGADWAAPVLCVAGSLIMLPAYSIYKHISQKTKAELSPEILRLSEEIIKESQGENRNV